jgi:4-carboxymuconolactone decarboxylase
MPALGAGIHVFTRHQGRPPRVPAAPMLASRLQTQSSPGGHRMTRIAIVDRAEMNAEQVRVYDLAKATSGIVGGPYVAYIRLPKVFEASQHLRAALAAGPLSRREQQIVNLAVARHWNARYPWYAQVRNSLAIGIEPTIIEAINAHKTPSLADARERTCFAVATEILAHKGLSDASYAAAERWGRSTWWRWSPRSALFP